MDIRVNRTKMMLVEAFEKLTKEKSFEEISVTEICERSTVRRNTFYRHFSDKYAFIEYYLQLLAERFMSEAEAESDLDDIQEYAQHMHKALIRFIETHQHTMKYVLGQSVPVGTVDLIIRQISEGINQRAASGLADQETKPDMPIEFLGFFYSAGMVHTLRWWHFEGKPVKADVLEQYCTDFLMRCYAGFAQKNR